MRIRVFPFVIAAVVLLGAADVAWAWGPATHIGLARQVLDNLGLLPAAVAALLARHGRAYLFGNVAADLVFAKKWSRVKQFCHHWSTAFRMLDQASDERSQAFAFGYLSHLAADTVAHGKYVPRQLAGSRMGLNVGHLYWELRADNLEAESTWQLLNRVLADNHVVEHGLLARHLTDTLLSFETNRLLFDGMNALTARETFRRTVGAWNRRSRRPLPYDLLEGYRWESLDRMVSILQEEKGSALLHEDPNGTSALMQARVHRRELRRRRRQGVVLRPRLREVVAALAPRPVGNDVWIAEWAIPVRRRLPP